MTFRDNGEHAKLGNWLKEPKASLVSWTKDPLKTVYWAFMNMHHEVPDSLADLKVSDEELKDFFKTLIKQPHTTVLEFINTNWKLDNVSRAFAQELTRTRQAAYSIQSLRIVDVGNFADNGNFHVPPEIRGKTELEEEFYQAMRSSQETYKSLIAKGAPVQAARGVLPLNIYSPITMSINMRSLIHTAELRLCENTQNEYREVMRQMKQEVSMKLSPLLAECMQPMCFRTKVCSSMVPCNKYNFTKEIQGDVTKWVKG